MSDLRGLSFDGFVAFAFDRPVPATDKDPNVVLMVEPDLQLEHGRRLFIDPLFLRERFNSAQLEQGFWFLSFSGISDYSDFFADQIWNDAASLDARLSAIRAS